MREFSIDLGWARLLDRLGVSPVVLLRAAGLPADLFERPRPSVDAEGFARLWAALERAVRHPAPGLLIGRAVDAETFSPALFAAFSSPTLAVALERLALFKPLFGPVWLKLRRGSGTLTVDYGSDPGVILPREFVAAELVFLVSLARMATRVEVHPRRVAMADPVRDPGYEEFLGCEVNHASANRLVFATEDAERPFLSVNNAMYAAFEPELRLRLDEEAAGTGLTERLRATLMEALPAGQTDIGLIARRLGLSARSLQRRLSDAGTSYRAELTALRTRLALDYLKDTARTNAEISYLLGYEDQSAFLRAFRNWTGTTPEGVRRGSVSGRPA